MQGNKITISATEITNCLRGVVFKKRGIEAPDLHPEIKKTLELFSEFGQIGQNIETKVKDFWKSKNSLIDSGNFIPSDEFGFTGRYDAICNIGDKLVLYEIKGVSNNFFEWVKQNKKPRDYNKIQLMIYHKALLKKYPDIEPRILYVSRKEFKNSRLTGVEVPISYTEEEFSVAITNADYIREALSGGPLPQAISAIENDPITGEKVISMGAITCRHHALCLENKNWYKVAKKELGLYVTSSSTSNGEELPF